MAVGVHLYWLPLGAGGTLHIVQWNGRLFELLVATHEHRPARDLYHCALEVHVDAGRFVVEMAPVWGNGSAGRGVVREGPVGFGRLGRSRFFRYEVRRWRDGVIPDALAAVGGPRRIATDESRAQGLLDLVPAFPTATWGRDELRAGDMWNSNSLISWLLARSGHDTDAIEPPANGRAPGWAAGLAVAARQSGTARAGRVPPTAGSLLSYPLPVWWGQAKGAAGGCPAAAGGPRRLLRRDREP